MSRNAVLARVELRTDDAVLAEGAADRLADPTYSAVGVDCSHVSAFAPNPSSPYHLSMPKDSDGRLRKVKHTLLANRARTRDNTRVLAGNSIGVLVGT